jgi:hypothetical protein
MRLLIGILGVTWISIFIYSTLAWVMCRLTLRWLRAELAAGKETFLLSEAPWYVRFSDFMGKPFEKWLQRRVDAE